MTAVAHIFAPITGADPKARTITVEVGRSRSGFDAVEGGRETVLAALNSLKGGTVVEMTIGAPEVGEVISVEEVGKQRIRLVGVITDPQTWRKLEHMVFKGTRLQLYADKGGNTYPGSLMLADAPAPEDMIVRRAGAADKGHETCLALDEARATLRELRRVLDQAEAFYRRPWHERQLATRH